MPPDTWILSGLGINCETETQHACLQAGSKGAELIPLSTLHLHGANQLKQNGLLIFPGGFLDGDDLGCARACVNRFRYQSLPDGRPFLTHLLDFIQQGGLILGICNGFQLLVKLGLLPWPEKHLQPSFTLTYNTNGRFENRWIHLTVNPQSPCIFTKNLTQLELPIRHSQGQLLPKNTQQLQKAQHLCPLFYSNPQGQPTQSYPHNPNGSPNAMAALCSPNGRIFGLMPHPEAAHLHTHHPSWTAKQGNTTPHGLLLLQNAYQFLHQ